MGGGAVIEFFVPGLPKAKGSMRGFAYKHKQTGKWRSALTNSDPKTRPWEDTVRWYAQQAGLQPASGPVAVMLCFYLPKPKKPKHETPTTKPDADKLARAVLDALTRVAWNDDSQVVHLEVSKLYAHDAPEDAGVRVRVVV